MHRRTKRRYSCFGKVFSYKLISVSTPSLWGWVPLAFSGTGEAPSQREIYGLLLSTPGKCRESLFLHLLILSCLQPKINFMWHQSGKCNLSTGIFRGGIFWTPLVKWIFIAWLFISQMSESVGAQPEQLQGERMVCTWGWSSHLASC